MGTGFVPGVKVQVAGRGFTVGTPTEVSSGSPKVTVAVANTVAVGTYKVTLANPDGGKGSQGQLPDGHMISARSECKDGMTAVSVPTKIRPSLGRSTGAEGGVKENTWI